MSKDFIGIIDGSGTGNDAVYETKMKDGFCCQISREKHISSFYLRGPSEEGYFIDIRAQEMVAQVQCRVWSRCFLAGYSRGGSIAVIAAKMLAKQGVDVSGLFLFDPVARHASSSSDEIPANVAAAYVARRIIGSPVMAKYDWMLLGDLAGHNPVRDWFGTTAKRFASPTTKRHEAYFTGSHGALGGVGWKAVEEDAACQNEVARWFNQAFLRERLPIRLTPSPPMTTR